MKRVRDDETLLTKKLIRSPTVLSSPRASESSFWIGFVTRKHIAETKDITLKTLEMHANEEKPYKLRDVYSISILACKGLEPTE